MVMKNDHFSTHVVQTVCKAPWWDLTYSTQNSASGFKYMLVKCLKIRIRLISVPFKSPFFKKKEMKINKKGKKRICVREVEWECNKACVLLQTRKECLNCQWTLMFYVDLHIPQILCSCQPTVCNEQRDSLHSLLSVQLPRGQKYWSLSLNKY